jgi:hypothetical protein
MFRKRSLFMIGVLGATTILGPIAATSARASKPFSVCVASPNPVASGAGLTVSGKTGHPGDWVNAYIYFSDSGWELLGGQVGTGGNFSLSGWAHSTYPTLDPAASGPGSVEIYSGSANKERGMVMTCSFSVS